MGIKGRVKKKKNLLEMYQLVFITIIYITEIKM